jgi:hypothetical protein
MFCVREPESPRRGEQDLTDSDRDGAGVIGLYHFGDRIIRVRRRPDGVLAFWYVGYPVQGDGRGRSRGQSRRIERAKNSATIE